MECQKGASKAFLYWGKAGAESQCHPLVYHAMDVAAVGQCLLGKQPRLRAFLARAAGVDERTLLRWVVFFLLIHDIGKFSGVFQRLRLDIVPPELWQPTQTQPYDIKHDALGYYLWRKELQALVQAAGLLGTHISGDPYWGEYFDYWARPMLCHHGMPLKEGHRQPPRIQSYLSALDRQAATAWVTSVAELLPQAPQRPEMAADFEQLVDQGYPAILSWWLAGVAILCDWLGSNQAFFPYTRELLAPADYWQQRALPAAERILKHTGILPVEAGPVRAPVELFERLQHLTPLQRQVQELPLGEDAQLFILEDVTGAGKTEAAFLLLNRLLGAGLADGFFMALPTMATANALYRRSVPVYQKLFAADAQPSLILAHGAAALNQGYRASVVPLTDTGDSDYENGEFSATSHCNGWLADNRKKALLAQAGVGTLDQALLATLQSRHQSLRLLGLLGKVLVVDEVHAADAYMHSLLQVLLELHATTGGSAILLSATLPQAMRRDLVQAFARGLNQDTPSLAQTAYPLLTQFSTEGINEIALGTRPEVARELHFACLPDETAVERWVLEQVTAGDCVCWVRNSVTDALTSFDHLSQGLRERGMPDERISLFHARFALGDRLAIEERVVQQFGLGSTADMRCGRILIATQVVEQSLDLDFDHLVSDLAPIDLLLQRAGRLRRHTRDAVGNPVAGQDQRGLVCLQVLTPAATETAGPGWLNAVLPRTARVYEDLGRLWRTARLITDRPCLSVPGGVRDWIEAVYQGDDLDLPEGLRRKSLEADGKRKGASTLALANTITPTAGYRMQQFEWWDETHTPTRLGEPTITLRLARWQDGRLVPWSEQDLHPWAYSEVNVRAALVQEPAMPDPACAEAVTRLLSQWRGGKSYFRMLPVIPSADGIWVGLGTNPGKNRVEISYSPTRGLEVRRTG